MGESGRDDDENLLLGVVHLGHTHGNYIWWGKHHCVKCPTTWCTSSEKLSNWVSLGNTHESHLLCCKSHVYQKVKQLVYSSIQSLEY